MKWITQLRLLLVLFVEAMPALALDTPFEKNAASTLPNARAVSSFLHQLADESNRISLVRLGRSAGDRPIEAVLVSKDEAFHRSGGQQAERLTLMMLGSQHGDEPAGAEALQALVRDLAHTGQFLDKLNLVVMALANPDGRDSGSRYNEGGENTNIDYVALAARETRLLVAALARFRPDLVYDVHESGVWKRVLTKEQGYLTDVEAQFEVGNNPNIDRRLREYGETVFLPALLERVRAAGLPAQRYRNEITRLEQAMTRGGLGITNMRNYAAMLGALSVLVENRLDERQGDYPSPRNIRERVRKQLLSARAMLEVAVGDSDTILSMTRSAQHQWNWGHSEPLMMEVAFGANEAQPKVIVPLRHVETGQVEEVSFDNRDAIEAGDPVALPSAYVIRAHQEVLSSWLEHHHIFYRQWTEEKAVTASRLMITVRNSVADKPGVREPLQVMAAEQQIELTLQPGDFWVPMDQPRGFLAALMLDPRSSNSLFQEEGYQAWLQEVPFFIYPVY